MPLTNGVFGASWTLLGRSMWRTTKSVGVLDSLCYQTLCRPDASSCLATWLGQKSQDHSRALQACISPTPRNWRQRPGRPRQTWLRTVRGRSAPIQSWTHVRAPKGTKQIGLADTHWNSYVTDKLQLMNVWLTALVTKALSPSQSHGSKQQQHWSPISISLALSQASAYINTMTSHRRMISWVNMGGWLHMEMITHHSTVQNGLKVKQ